MTRALELCSLLAALALCAAASQAASQEPAGFSAQALYNSANSYARAGKRGMAVLNFERALLLDPSDPDVRANLQHVRQAAGLAPESHKGFDRMASIANPQTFSWLGLIGVAVAGTSLLARRRYPRRRHQLGAAAIVGLFLIGLTLCTAIAVWPKMHKAVVMTATEARVSPVPMGEPLFELREAETVKMTAQHDSFVLIQTTTGRRGWVSREDLAAVVPQPSKE